MKVEVGYGLEPVADLDLHLPVALGNEQEEAVVGALLTDLPGAEEAVGIILDRIALKIGHGRDHDLATRLRCKPGQLLGQRRLVPRREQVGIVHHLAG